MPRRNTAGVQMKPPATVAVMAKGVLYAYFLSLLVFLLVSILVQYTQLTEAILPFVSYATALVTIFVGAAYVANRLKINGWLNGGITGLIYLFGLLIFAFVLVPEFTIHIGYISKVFLAFAAGVAGGIFGINS